MRKSRGFTLIELLVVVAIIGLLSSVVLASLNSAKLKANDAAIQSDLNTIQTQSQIYYNDHGNYGSNTSTIWPFSGNPSCTNSGATNTLFTDDATISNALIALGKLTGPSYSVVCATSADGSGTHKYSITVLLNAKSPSGSQQYLCIDSQLRVANESYYYNGMNGSCN